MKTPQFLSVLLLAVWDVLGDIIPGAVDGEIPGPSAPDEQVIPADVTMFSSLCSCPNLPVAPITVELFSMTQPFYVNFYPRTYKYANLDNVCFTVFPLPDNPLTVINYVSYVYSDGSNQVESYIVSEVNPGAFRKGAANCNLAELAFASIMNGTLGCTDTILVYSCYLSGECPKQDNVVLPVYGLSTTYQAVLPSCLAEVEAKIGSFLLPPQEFVALPMKLPSRCVIRQISNLYPAKQRFQNVLGINSQPYTCSQYF